MPAFLAGGIREHLRFLIPQLTLSPALSPRTEMNGHTRILGISKLIRGKLHPFVAVASIIVVMVPNRPVGCKRKVGFEGGGLRVAREGRFVRRGGSLPVPGFSVVGTAPDFVVTG